MSKQTINIGASPNDGTGTPLRTSFDYTNQNFTEIYTALGGGVALPGATTQVIFNDGGTNLAGDAGLVYNKTTDALTVGGAVNAASATITGAATVGTTLGVTGVSTFAAGTALLPALTTTGDTNTGIYYPAADTFAVTTGGTERYRVDSSGNLGVGVTPSAGNGAIQLSAGVGFPATQVASANANTLDDYEEGTFTPTVRGSTVAGTGVYTTQVGFYTKVGRLVTVTVYLNWTAVTSGTGNLQFAGLPFSASSSPVAYNGISIAFASNIATTAGTVLYGSVEPGATAITMTQTPTGGGAYALVPLDTSGEISFSATYTAA